MSVLSFTVRLTLFLQEPKALDVVVRPPRLLINHAPQGFRPECLAWLVEGDRHATTVGVTVELVATGLAGQKKPVTRKGADEFASGE
jgi:hypothetical protein